MAGSQVGGGEMLQWIGCEVSVDDLQAVMDTALGFDDLSAKEPAYRPGSKDAGINVKKFHE